MFRLLCLLVHVSFVIFSVRSQELFDETLLTDSVDGGEISELVVMPSVKREPIADEIYMKRDHRFTFKQLIVPTTLVCIGLTGVMSDWVRCQNKEIRDEIQKNVNGKFTFDNYTQYAPMVSVYALNLCGVKGKHNLLDRTIILATSAAIMAITVNSLKYTISEPRPDGSSHNSFPSGHTATAFMGAEFMRREFRDVPWIGAAGYIVAAGTGFIRMYNNRHWFTDVLAGAGVGVLSTKAAYWILPQLNKLFHLDRRKSGITVQAVPMISTDYQGVSCVITI